MNIISYNNIIILSSLPIIGFSSYVMKIQAINVLISNVFRLETSVNFFLYSNTLLGSFPSKYYSLRTTSANYHKLLSQFTTFCHGQFSIRTCGNCLIYKSCEPITQQRQQQQQAYQQQKQQQQPYHTDNKATNMA